MKEAKYRLVKDWLIKAKSDLASAKKLATGAVNIIWILQSIIVNSVQKKPSRGIWFSTISELPRLMTFKTCLQMPLLLKQKLRNGWKPVRTFHNMQLCFDIPVNTLSRPRLSSNGL